MKAGEQAAPRRLPLPVRVCRKLQFPSCLVAHAPFSSLFIGAELKQMGGRGGNGMNFGPSDWRRLGLLSAFYGRG